MYAYIERDSFDDHWSKVCISLFPPMLFEREILMRSKTAKNKSDVGFETVIQETKNPNKRFFVVLI